MSEMMLSKIRNMLSVQLGVSEEEINLNTRFGEDLGADSLDLIELIMTLEEEYDIEISEEEAETIETVEDAIKFINKHK